MIRRNKWFNAPVILNLLVPGKRYFNGHFQLHVENSYDAGRSVYSEFYKENWLAKKIGRCLYTKSVPTVNTDFLFLEPGRACLCWLLSIQVLLNTMGGFFLCTILFNSEENTRTTLQRSAPRDSPGFKYFNSLQSVLYITFNILFHNIL